MGVGRRKFGGRIIHVWASGSVDPWALATQGPTSLLTVGASFKPGRLHAVLRYRRPVGFKRLVNSRVCMYVCRYVCMFVCICMYGCMCVCVHLSMYIFKCMRLCMHVCMCAYMWDACVYVLVRISLSLYIYEYMHACMHAWTYECNLCMREKEVHMIVTCV